MKNFLLMMLCVTSLGVAAQDLHFSQFYEAPLLRNPSLAGIFSGDVRVQMVYRDQWNSFTNAYKTGSLNAEYKAPVGKGDDFLTIGLQMLYDKAGTVGLTTTQIMPALNYHKSVNGNKNSYISVGFMGGIVEKRIDRSKVTTNAQFDGVAYNPALADGEAFATPKFNYFDGAVGVSYNSVFGTDDKHSYFVGFAYHHLNRPRNSFYRTAAGALNPKYVVSGGLKFNVDDYTYFTLQADHSSQGTFKETIGGALYSYKMGDSPDAPLYTLHFGAFLRWKDALIPVVKIDYDPFSIGLSYDVNISQLKTVSQGRGGFELSVVYAGFLDRYNSSRDKVLCPRF
ncbi:MAG: PorP/SprF family type IX secretion system membrane protein [Gemmatimonadaceae bacterium]|nr:PorP/SprF family type IX secretion system membrane protein [Chitinophagaceae bacterium]